MTLATPVQPDQRPEAWDDHVGVYETAFEPLTNRFAAAALAKLEPIAGATLLDVGAGAGGAALQAARRGARVCAIDASARMISRICDRADAAKLTGLDAVQMDAASLAFPDARFDLGLSVFGIVLIQDAARAMSELRRVLKLGGHVAIVTWTEPHRYELAARLREAIIAVRGEELPSGSLPAQLRYIDPFVFRGLVEAAGFTVEAIERVEAPLEAPAAAWLGERLAFAPGLAAMLNALGPDRAAVVDEFVSKLEADQGKGSVSLGSVAHIALARAG